jgi:hypothetical protein
MKTDLSDLTDLTDGWYRMSGEKIFIGFEGRPPDLTAGMVLGLRETERSMPVNGHEAPDLSRDDKPLFEKEDFSMRTEPKTHRCQKHARKNGGKADRGSGGPHRPQSL